MSLYRCIASDSWLSDSFLWKWLIPQWMPNWCSLLKAALSPFSFPLPGAQTGTDLSSLMLTAVWTVLISWMPAGMLMGCKARTNKKKRRTQKLNIQLSKVRRGQKHAFVVQLECEVFWRKWRKQSQAITRIVLYWLYWLYWFFYHSLSLLYFLTDHRGLVWKFT